MQPSPGTPPPTKSNRNFQSSRRGGLAPPDPSFLHFLPKEGVPPGVPPPPACFLAKSADALKKRVALFLSAKKRNRVRKNVKRKGIDRRHAETRADLNCTNFEEGGTRPAYTPPVKDGSFSKQRSCGTSIL